MKSQRIRKNNGGDTISVKEGNSDMERVLPIRDIYAREILDSGGKPAVEIEILAGEDTVGKASVSVGIHAGAEETVEYVNSQAARTVIGMNVFDQKELDLELAKMCAEDDENGGNRSGVAKAALGISLAAARTAAEILKEPLYRYVGGIQPSVLPLPVISMIRGGTDAENTLDIKDFMIIPSAGHSLQEQLHMGTEIYRELKCVLMEKGFHTFTDESGGFIPNLPDAGTALGCMREAAEKAGYRMGRDVRFALDMSVRDLYDEEKGRYLFRCEGQIREHPVMRQTEEMIDFYEELVSEFPICLIQEPLIKSDCAGWEMLARRLGERVCLTEPVRADRPATLTAALRMMEKAREKGQKRVLSCCERETGDTWAADIAVACSAEFIRAGAPGRLECTSKYNRLLYIAERTG